MGPVAAGLLAIPALRANRYNSQKQIIAWFRCLPPALEDQVAERCPCLDLGLDWVQPAQDRGDC